VVAKNTGEGEFNAPERQLAAIKAKDFGKYADPKLKTVPVNYLATLDITGGNSGSAALNVRGELIGLAFDGTLDSIISRLRGNDGSPARMPYCVSSTSGALALFSRLLRIP
jgi:hypothetical protein